MYYIIAITTIHVLYFPQHFDFEYSKLKKILSYMCTINAIVRANQLRAPLTARYFLNKQSLLVVFSCFEH